jgi:hypothetical protein
MIFDSEVAWHLSDRYRELYLNQMGQNPVSARSIATRAKLHQSTLSHFALKGGQMRYDHLVALLKRRGSIACDPSSPWKSFRTRTATTIPRSR